jgi:hypothetical protein
VEGDKQTTQFVTEGYTVIIEANPPGLRIVDASGRELERVSEDELRAEKWPEGEGDFAMQLISMAGRANRVARGAEKAIASILSSLSAPPQKKPAPPPAPQPAPAVQAQPQPAPQPPPIAVAAPQPTAPQPPAPPPLPPQQATPSQPPIPFGGASPRPRPITPPPTAAPAQQAAPAPVHQPAPPPPQPAPRPTTVAPAVPVRTFEPGKPAEPAPRGNMFGGISSFGKSEPRNAAPQPAAASQPAPQPAPRPVVTGFSAVSRQTVNSDEPPRPAASDPYKPFS